MLQPAEQIVCPGLFYAVPAQDGIISRLRLPGGILTSQQSALVAYFAEQYGDGYVQITNRANLQIRAVRTLPSATMLTTLQRAGLAAVNTRIDHLRNIMASPTAGIDPHALIDTRTLVTALDHAITQHEEFAGLSAKFSIGFDGGEAVSVRPYPNDIWLVATAARPDTDEPLPVSFRLFCNSGQGQEVDLGLLVRPEECILTVVAMAHVYLEHTKASGPGATGKKPRLKEVLAQRGVAWYLEQMARFLPLVVSRQPQALQRSAGGPPQYRHIGTQPQQQPGFYYVGMVTPLGRLTAQQLRELGALAQLYGSGTLRLTPWQTVLMPDIPTQHLAALQQAIDELGLPRVATHPWSALVACAGSPGCRASATHTTHHALDLANFLTQHDSLDRPVNIHFSGCPKSCAQHYPSDVALLGTTVPQGDATVEGYQVFVGTGEQPFGRVLYDALPAAELPVVLSHLLQVYREHRQTSDEALGVFANRYSIAELQQFMHPISTP